MSKNPAFLFYPGDWLAGTMFMSIEEKGAYITLLCAQFEHGPLSEEKILQIITLQLWENIRHKFKKNSKGFYNKRLQFEQEKREKYTKSRGNNRRNISNSYENDKQDTSSSHDIDVENENENENKDDNTVDSNKEESKDFDDLYKKDFERARKLYPGSKRGLDTEFDYFTIKIKDWKDVITMLAPAIEKQIELRQKKINNNEWVPEWKQFRSWIFNRFWELELEEGSKEQVLTVGG